MAFLHHHLTLGGAEQVTLSTAELFLSMGIRSFFFAGSHIAEEFVLPNELANNVRLFPCDVETLSERNLQFVEEQIRELSIDLMFVTCNAPQLTELAERGQRAGCQMVYWLHSIPFWQTTHRREQKLRKWRKGLAKGLEGLVSVYISDPITRAPKRVRQAYRQHIEAFDKYIVLCPEYRTELIETLDLPEHLASKIYPIVNPITIAPDVVSPRRRQIVYLGRLTDADKRVDRLLKVWSKAHERLPDWELRIYGKGVEESYLRRLAERLRLPRLEFCGYTDSPGVVLAESEVLCMTSSYEGWPMALIEAQNRGVVPIAFECCAGITSIIGQSNEAGMLIPPYQIDRYADELVALCQDDERRAELRQACLEHRHRYTHEANRAVWDSILGIHP